jgi:hypothetical protein
MWSLLAGFVGGMAAWIATEVVAKPIARFMQLRSDAAMALALYEDQTWKFENPDVEPPDADGSESVENYTKFRDQLCSPLHPHNASYPFLHHKALGRHRCYVSSAGSSLKGLGEAHPATAASDQLQRAVVSGLKLKSS